MGRSFFRSCDTWRTLDDRSIVTTRENSGSAILMALAMGPKLLTLDQRSEGIGLEQNCNIARSLASQSGLAERVEIVARGRGADMQRAAVKAMLAV